jgi:hypothetical protein
MQIRNVNISFDYADCNFQLVLFTANSYWIIKYKPNNYPRQWYLSSHNFKINMQNNEEDK